MTFKIALLYEHELLKYKHTYALFTFSVHIRSEKYLAYVDRLLEVCFLAYIML